MSNVIQQHYVPQFILRNFLGADGMVEVLERGKDVTWRSKPDKVACERYYNAIRVDDGTLDTQSVERQLGECEDKSAPLIQSLLSGTPLLEKDRIVLAQFFAFQNFRSPRQRQEYADALLAFEHNNLGDGGPISTSAMLERMRSACANPSRLRVDGGFNDARLVMNEDGSVDVSREETVAAMAIALDFVPIIAGMDWTLFRAEVSSPFIISDSPFYLWENPNTLPPHTGPGFWRPGTRFSMPLSSTVTLVGNHTSQKSAESIWRYRPVAFQRANKQTVLFLNQLQMASAHRFLYAASPHERLRQVIAEMQTRKTTIALAPLDANGKPISPRLIRAK